MATATRLRRPTLVAAPMFVVGIMGCTAALASILWAAWHPDDLDATFVVAEAVSVLVGLGAFAAARGCFVDVDPERRVVRDAVAWVTVRRIAQDRIVTARVRAGAWRWFELELDDGGVVVVAGACPAQFPSRLMPGARERDLADLDLLMGQDGASADDGADRGTPGE